MKINLDIKNVENINPTPEQIEEYNDIITALITSGGLDGVKGGQTIIHFDQDGVFMGISLNYWPWRRKKN